MRKVEDSGKLVAVIPIREQLEYRERRELFMDIVLSNVNDLIDNYQQFRDKVVSMQKMASMLEVSVKEVKELYPNMVEVYALLGIIEAIVYSREKVGRKLELCLEVFNNEEKVSMGELVHIIQVLKGRDLSVESKIKAILQSKRIKMDEYI
jgi:DNA-binding transcriptional regulator YhcF (GntR family)